MYAVNSHALQLDCCWSGSICSSLLGNDCRRDPASRVIHLYDSLESRATTMLVVLLPVSFSDWPSTIHKYCRTGANCEGFDVVVDAKHFSCTSLTS